MDAQVYRAILYYVFPGLALSLTVYGLYQVLATPLGCFIIPAMAGVAGWLSYRGTTAKTIQKCPRSCPGD